jgi:hypothetical protein
MTSVDLPASEIPAQAPSARASATGGVIGFVEESWGYGFFVPPLFATAIGIGMTNGPASSAAGVHAISTT